MIRERSMAKARSSLRPATSTKVAGRRVSGMDLESASTLTVPFTKEGGSKVNGPQGQRLE